MNLSLTVLNQVLVMFGLILIGVLCFKAKFINDSGKQQITTLLLYIVNPLMVINAYQTPYEPRLAKNLIIAFGLGVFSHLLAMAIAYLFVHKKGNEARVGVERFAIIYTNCGFMAFPLINALYGAEGVFYASAYMTIFNLFSWTHGYIMMSGKTDKSALKKAFLSPVVISVGIGLLIFFLKIELPSVITSVVSYSASLNTPLAMIVTGISLAQINIVSAFKSIRCYYIIFLMNIVVPLAATVIYLFLPIEQELLIVNLIAMACPCAVTTLLFATKLNRDSEYATKLLTVANVSCILTIPAIIFLYQTFKSFM